MADLVLSYFNALAWPTTVIMGLVLFRVSIRGLLGSVEEFEGFGVKAKIGRQVNQAALDSHRALDESPVEQVSVSPRPADQYPVSRFRFIAPRMKEALRFSSPVSRHAPAAARPVATDPQQDMRSVVDRLDLVVTAVLVVIATSDPPPERTNVIPWETGVRADMTATAIEERLVSLTGLRGWRGVIESRDVLRGTLTVMCGKSGQAVSPADALLFVAAGNRALSQWHRLVNDFVDSVRRLAQ